jgi:DNA repair protein RecN (Recombination protein N)
MLLELDIRDFAIIDHLRLRFAPGFNAITGETGAGKSIVVDAVGLVIGERADTTFVRAGAERTVVEALVDPGPAAERCARVLETYGIDPAAELIIAREVYAAGRSVARVNGRAVPVRALVELGSLAIDIHGQSDQMSLLRESEHLGLLDRYAGLAESRLALARAVREIRAVEAALAELERASAEGQRRADLLAFQVEEITAAQISIDEEAELLTERTRLANGERLARLAEVAYGALRGAEDLDAGGIDRVDDALGSIGELVRIDASLAGCAEAALGAAEALREVADQLRDYREALDFSPGRLEEVEERLTVLAELKRKYGGEIPAILAHAERAAAELALIEGSEARLAELAAERARGLETVGALAGALSARRRAAAESLASAVEAEIAALSMAGARFAVAIDRRRDPAGAPVDGETWAFDESGIDHAAFQVSMNPGEPLRPLARVASGGETARLMLALRSILSAVDEMPTLIFDEIDAGIGGRVGAVVGQKLWGLAGRHQVLCVTHLPQVAAYGDAHFHVRKALAGERTTTAVDTLSDAERAEEIMHMLGGGGAAARENALAILQQAELWKRAARRDGDGQF